MPATAWSDITDKSTAYDYHCRWLYGEQSAKAPRHASERLTYADHEPYGGWCPAEKNTAFSDITDVNTAWT